MGNLGGASQKNGQPDATNAGQGQGTTGTTTLGISAFGFVVDNTGLGAAQTALRQSGIQPAAFHAASAAAAAGAHPMAPTVEEIQSGWYEYQDHRFSKVKKT